MSRRPVFSEDMLRLIYLWGWREGRYIASAQSCVAFPKSFRAGLAARPGCFVHHLTYETYTEMHTFQIFGFQTESQLNWMLGTETSRRWVSTFDTLKSWSLTGFTWKSALGDEIPFQNHHFQVLNFGGQWIGVPYEKRNMIDIPDRDVQKKSKTLSPTIFFKSQINSRWWFQPIRSNMPLKLDHFNRDRGENKEISETTRLSTLEVIIHPPKKNGTWKWGKKSLEEEIRFWWEILLWDA